MFGHPGSKLGPPLRDAEKYATYGVIITESGQHFLGIVGGILDVARAETK